MNYGIKFKPKQYACTYWFKGDRWHISVVADDWADAEARCKKLGLTLDGEIQAIIPARVGWIARLIVWWKNL